MKYLKKICILTGLDDKYKLAHTLGKGGSAEVRLGYRRRDNAEFAIKTISKNKATRNPELGESLIKEIAILRILDHPNIIKLHQVYESRLYIHIILEYAKGMTLLSFIKKQGKQSEEYSSLIASKILKALEYCHSKNIIHRDIKPENIIIEYKVFNYRNTNENFELKVIDFGLATFFNPSVPETLVCGSPGYIAPEVYTQFGYDFKIDIFSLGTIMHLMYFFL